MPITADWYELGRRCIGELWRAAEPASSAAFCTAGSIVVVTVRPPWSNSDWLMPMSASSALTCRRIMPTGLSAAQVLQELAVGFLTAGYFRAAYSAGLIQFMSSMFF